MAAQAGERQRWRWFIRSNISAREGVSNSGGPAGEGGSNDLDEAFASLQRRQNLGKHRLEPGQKLPLPRVRNPHPDDWRTATLERFPLRKILVFGDNDGAGREGKAPDRIVGGVAETDFPDVLGVMSRREEPARERRRQLRIDEKAHQATRKIG